MTARRLRPPWWAVLAAGAAVTLFGTLAAWQLQRGHAKAQLHASYAQPGPAAALHAGMRPDPAGPSSVTAIGTWFADRTLLQDGQSHEGRPGYHVWSPLRLQDGTLALVNRGWVAGVDYELAPPEGPAQVTGLWRSLPEPGVRLAGTQNCPPRLVFPLVVLYPTEQDLACIFGEPVAPGLLLLDPAEPHGFLRAWSAPGMTPERHYGYALQWLALALATLILFVILNLKRP